MHMHSLAPVLSATSRYVYIWIITLSACTSGDWAALTDAAGQWEIPNSRARRRFGLRSRTRWCVGIRRFLTTRINRQFFVLDSGRVSMISTVSPSARLVGSRRGRGRSSAV